MKYVSVIVFVILQSFISKAQTISTFAGGGSSSAEGVAATTARIGSASCGFFDKYQNYYLVDGNGNKIRKINTAGSITTICGTGVGGFSGDGGAAIDAQLFGPSALTLDSMGNIYIVDAGNFRIRKIDAITGVISTIAGIGIAGSSGDGGGRQQLQH